VVKGLRMERGSEQSITLLPKLLTFARAAG
jgi:hypothetical protein